jgi:hypothetical protein
MRRSSSNPLAGYETYMPVFLERFVLRILVALAVGVCVFNPWKWDWNQRISLFLGVVCLAYFFAYTSHRSKSQAGEQPPAATATEPANSVNTTTGPQSPIMPNNSGAVEITSEPTGGTGSVDNNEKKPPKESKPRENP